MATIDLGTALYYRGGQSGVSSVVGNDWESGAPITRVARYTFQAPRNGAASISLRFTGTTFGDGNYIVLRYFIGDDPDSHADAGAAYEYTGDLTRNGGTFTAYASSAPAFMADFPR